MKLRYGVHACHGVSCYNAGGLGMADACAVLCSTPWPIEMLQEGKIDVKPMITHRFGFTGRDEVIAGFEVRSKRKPGPSRSRSCSTCRLKPDAPPVLVHTCSMVVV